MSCSWLIFFCRCPLLTLRLGFVAMAIRVRWRAMERNEHMCLESPSSPTEIKCTSTSLHLQVNQISTRSTLHFLYQSVVWGMQRSCLAQIKSMSECVVCLDAKDVIVCDAICWNSVKAVHTSYPQFTSNSFRYIQ